MRVAVIGAGGVGSAAVRILARREFPTRVVVADFDEAKAVAAVAASRSEPASLSPMRPAISSCRAKTSVISRSKRSDQSEHPSAALMSCAVMRTRGPARRTLPSSTVRTPSFAAIARRSSCCPLNANDDVRAAFARRKGDLRETLFDLFDLYRAKTIETPSIGPESASAPTALETPIAAQSTEKIGREEGAGRNDLAGE